MNTRVKALAALITAALLAPAQAALISTKTVNDFVDLNIQVTASGDFTAPMLSQSGSSYTESLYRDVTSYAKTGKEDFKTVKSEDGKKYLVQQRYVDQTYSYSDVAGYFYYNLQDSPHNSYFYRSGTGSLSFSGTLQINNKANDILEQTGGLYTSVGASAGGEYSGDLYSIRTKRPTVDIYTQVGQYSQDSQESHTRTKTPISNTAQFSATASSSDYVFNFASPTSFAASIVGERFNNAGIMFGLAGQLDLYKINEKYTFTDRWVTTSETVAPVPEPETYALMGMGLVGLIAARRRKTKTA